MILGGVNAAHWWGPAGWLYRNTPGNLAASAIAFGAGWALKGREVVRHLKSHGDMLDELHRFHGIGQHAANETE